MQPLSSNPLGARIAIWSIQYQDRISYHFRLSILIIAMIVTLLGMLGVVSLAAALWSLFSGGLLMIGAAWYLIRKRRTWLLNIQDPDLKRVAYDTMLTYIVLKRNCLRQANPGKECAPQSVLVPSKHV